MRDERGKIVGDTSADEERRRLMAAAYGRAGADLEPEQARRLAELLAPADDAPAAQEDEHLTPGPQAARDTHRPRTRVRVAGPVRRALLAVGAAVILVVTFVAGWAGHDWAQAPDTAASWIPVSETVATTLNAARVEIANEADPDTLVYIGMLYGSVVWEARSVDGESRCFVIAAIPDASQPSSADLLSCTAETTGAAELWSTSASGETYTARSTIQAVWREGTPAQLEPVWHDVTISALEPNAIINRTRPVPPHDAVTATPVAVSGLTALWAVDQDGLRCVYAITLSGSDVNTAGYESAASCRERVTSSEQTTWIFPGPEFSFPPAPSGRYVRTVVTWLPGQDPVATLREE